MPRLLLTGASGFLGTALRPRLEARGFKVVGIARRKAPGVDITTDLLDATQTQRAIAQARAEHLVHAAWIATPGIFWTSESNDAWAASSSLLLREFYAAGGRSAIGIGSCAEYAWGTDPLTEDSLLEPQTHYGAAKVRFSREGFALAESANAGFAWARIFFLYGAGEPPEKFVTATARQLLAGADFDLREPERRLDFVHVADAADAIARIAAQPANGAFNIGSGTAVRVADAAAEIARAAGRELRLFSSGAGDGVTVRASTARMAEQYGWLPRVSFESGIREIVEKERAACTSA